MSADVRAGGAGHGGEHANRHDDGHDSARDTGHDGSRDTAHDNGRLAAVIGVALAACAALWWLSATRLALAGGADAGRAASRVLQTIALVRGMALPIWVPRVALAQGAGRGVRDALGLVAPAWPLVALAGAASPIAAWRLLAVEAALVAGVALWPLVGSALRRVPGDAERADLAATFGGVAVAALLWFGHMRWPFLVA